MKRFASRSHGVVLLFSIAILALLSILAVVFATTSKMERNVSRNYVDDARAKMCANAGLEVAMSAIREMAGTQAWDDPYASSGRYARLIFPLDPARNTYDSQWGFAIELAQNPSLMGGPTLISGGSVSGTPAQQLASTYDPGRDYYRLKVLDCAAQLNVNMFDISGGPSSSAWRVLEGMLNALGNAIQTVYGGINPLQGNAAALLNFRLAQGTTPQAQVFATEAQIAEALRGPFPNDYMRRYSILRDFVTTRGWVDDTQCVAGNYRQGVDFPIRPNARLDTLRRTRCPVNVNSASVPVLVAVLQGLCGYELGVAGSGAAILGVQPIVWTKTLCPAIPPNTALSIANALVNRRRTSGPFKTWSEFETFVDSLALSVQWKSVVKQNANPNLRFNKFNPNDVVYDRIDKVDLGYVPPGGSSASPQKGGTTELSFSSLGYYEIESLGRVSKFDGNREVIQASKVLFTVVKVFDAIRQTTQFDFITNRVSATRARTYPESINETSFGGEDGDESTSLNSSGIGGPNPNAGQIAIGTEWRSTRLPGDTWYHSFEGALSATSPGQGPLECQKHETGGAISWPGNMSVQDGNDLVPEGLLNWRLLGGLGEELNFRMGPGVIGDQASALSGSADLWIKLASDPTQGSDEVLFYAVKEMYTGIPRPNQRWGLAWKLERFGTRIRSTRFLYGFPDRETVTPLFRAPGVLAPGNGVTLAYTEVDFFANGWRAHEWHRLSHTWTSGTDQTLSVDGRAPIGMTFQLARDQMRGRQQVINGFRLITLDADQRFQVGGYNFTPTLGMAVYNQQWSTAQGRALNRYPNATIDEVRFGSSPTSRGPSDRYGIQNGATWQGKIPASSFGRGRLGTVSYTVYYPKAYGTTTYTSAQFRIGFNAGIDQWTLEPPPPGAPDGEGYAPYGPTAPPIPKGRDFLFNVSFRNLNGVTPLCVTPVFDDITVTWMGAPTMLEYSWISRPDPQP